MVISHSYVSLPEGKYLQTKNTMESPWNLQSRQPSWMGSPCSRPSREKAESRIEVMRSVWGKKIGHKYLHKTSQNIHGSFLYFFWPMPIPNIASVYRLGLTQILIHGIYHGVFCHNPQVEVSVCYVRMLKCSGQVICHTRLSRCQSYSLALERCGPRWRCCLWSKSNSWAQM